jgi:transcriptional regulator with XRE-family HTH domain
MSGDELKQRRDALVMTQEQLGDALGVAANTIARWEREERAIPSYLSLAMETVERGKLKKPVRALGSGSVGKALNEKRKGGKK